MTTTPSRNPFKGLEVRRSKIVLSLLPAHFSNPSPITDIPNRNMASPPNKDSRLKISIFLFFHPFEIYINIHLSVSRYLIHYSKPFGSMARLIWQFMKFYRERKNARLFGQGGQRTSHGDVFGKKTGCGLAEFGFHFRSPGVITVRKEGNTACDIAFRDNWCSNNNMIRIICRYVY